MQHPSSTARFAVMLGMEKVMLCLLLAMRASFVVAGHAEVSPVHKVVELLGEMLAKGKKEKHAEEVGFAKFQEWCEGVHAEKTKTIKEAADQIAQLEADILKAESDTEVLRDEITQLEAVMAKKQRRGRCSNRTAEEGTCRLHV